MWNTRIAKGGLQQMRNSMRASRKNWQRDGIHWRVFRITTTPMVTGIDGGLTTTGVCILCEEPKLHSGVGQNNLLS